MAGKMTRLSQLARKLNVGTATIVETLASKGHEIDNKPNTKITPEQHELLVEEFASSATEKEEASGLKIGKKHESNINIESEKKEPEPEPDVQEEAPEEEEDLTEISKEELLLASKKVQLPEKEDSPHKLQGIKVVGKIDLSKDKNKKEEEKAEEAEKEEKKPAEPKKEEEEKVEVEETEIEHKQPEEEVKVPEEKQKPAEKKEEPKPEEKQEEKTIEAKSDQQLKGLTVVGKIDLPKKQPDNKKKQDEKQKQQDRADQKGKRKRKRMAVAPSSKQSPNTRRQRQDKGRGGPQKTQKKEELSDKEIQEQIKQTLARLSGGKGGQRGKYRKEKRSAIAEEEKKRQEKEESEQKLLKVTEYISANDLASFMDVNVNEIISSAMGMGMFVSINQRLDAEAITMLADEFGYDVEFTSAEDEETDIIVQEDDEDTLVDRPPIVTIMGHVDHGKTSLLDFIRDSKVTEGEAGGITQHIGAYSVKTESGKPITFLDTPGHEAFTAMRARGAKVTDVVIIVVAADDDVMPQTKEAINHAQVAGVPIIIAINKIDKPNANADKIKEALSKENILVEDWGGKYQCAEISAKTGQGIDDLLDKVLLEAELLELKANPEKRAVGTVVESLLDKGRGYVTTILVQGGTLNMQDVVLAGAYYGKVKAMFDHRQRSKDEVGPSYPVQMLGLDGAPQAGDKFQVMANEREAREIATKRQQIQREQTMRTKKHITLDEIGRRLAIGNFKELNVIVKADVDGSLEALSDSLLKLSTEEVQVNIIHKGVGAITESDVLLASASDAVVIGFQVRPVANAKILSEKEEIEIRLYSIIYDTINDIKDAMEGMLEPKKEEKIIGNAEIRETFKISKVGTIAGCMVTDGFVRRDAGVRLVREGIVTYTGELETLKRFKEDVQEVKKGYECGMNIKGYNDIQEGDIIEFFVEEEVKRKL